MFTIYRVYKESTYDTDGTISTYKEHTNTISAALTACALYLEDPDCVHVEIWRHNPCERLFDYWRE